MAVGAALLPTDRRTGTGIDRVYRGVEAAPYSWPWIAKLKVRKPGPARTARNTDYCPPDLLPGGRRAGAAPGLRRGADRTQICVDGAALC